MITSIIWVQVILVPKWYFKCVFSVVYYSTVFWFYLTLFRNNSTVAFLIV